MSYINWFNKHSKKHKIIVDKLLNLNYSKSQIIDYFEYENMAEKEVDFCPLYAKGKRCHDIENLNCYLCACPNFRFDDSGLDVRDGNKILSICSIGNGEEFVGKGLIHQNCSSCEVPHKRDFIENIFELKWEDMMGICKS